MSITSALDRYIAAWNDHDPRGVVDALTPDGTYEDPTTGGPLDGDALEASVAGVITGFPDVRFEEVDVRADGTSATLQWIMHGTNTGPMPGGPATGGTIALPGVDVIDYDPDTDRLSKVLGFFDTATMLGQLGLVAHITPQDMPPVMEYGYGLRIDTQREGAPGAFTVTWIDIDADKRPTLQQGTQAIVMEQLGNDAYLGSCFLVLGRRNYTFSAWTSSDEARQALRGGEHAAAMRATNKGELGDNALGITSIWEPTVMNGVFHPGPGKSAELDELDGQWL